MRRRFVLAASEFLAFMLLVSLVGLIAPWSLLVIFVINSIAGTIIADIKLYKVVVLFKSEIEENRISLVWGIKKILRNNLWWR